MSQRQRTADINIPSHLHIRLALVRAEFNSDITEKQLEYATRWCDAHGVAYDVSTVAGAFEIPWMIQSMLATGTYSGAVALGCLIKGDTPHFDVIMHAVAHGIQKLSLDIQKPIGFGILTTLNREQALARLTIGEDAARAVVLSLLQTYGAIREK